METVAQEDLEGDLLHPSSGAVQKTSSFLMFKVTRDAVKNVVSRRRHQGREISKIVFVTHQAVGLLDANTIHSQQRLLSRFLCVVHPIHAFVTVSFALKISLKFVDRCVYSLFEEKHAYICSFFKCHPFLVFAH